MVGERVNLSQNPAKAELNSSFSLFVLLVVKKFVITKEGNYENQS